MKRIGFVAAITAAIAALAFAAAACGGGGNDNGSSGGGSTSPTRPSAGGEAPSSELTIVGKNTLFDKNELVAKAGEITITFDNQDGGVPHDFAIFESEDDANAGKEPIAATEIENGPVTQTLKVTLEPGEYFYRCNVHPTTMTGTLKVES